MTETTTINDKIRQIFHEMKLTGIWTRQVPEWVMDFEKRDSDSQEDFSAWLQFVFLPNYVQGTYKSMDTRRKHIVLQAKKFWGNDIQKGKLLQLLVELDAMG